LMTLVESALARIGDGTFGECLSCGQEISLPRLKAVPWSRYCITCQELIEKHGGIASQRSFTNSLSANWSRLFPPETDQRSLRQMPRPACSRAREKDAPMNSGFALWLFAVSLGASALGGMLGMASGIFIVPILTIFGHLDIHTAIGASIVSVIACSCGGASPYLRGRLTNIRLAIVLEVATTLGALSGVLLSGIIPVAYLYYLFTAILLVSAQQMLAKRGDPVTTGAVNAGRWATTLGLHSSYPDHSLGEEIGYQVDRVPMGMMLMYGAGMISALLGIGSGVLKIPAMDTALRLPIKVSSATSNFMIGVTAAASAGAYFMQGKILPAVAGPVALGSVVGAILGARILMRTANAKLRVMFVVVLVVFGIQMLLKALGIHVPWVS
jgi:uncharacterized protein